MATPDLVDAITHQLRDQGFSRIEVSRTLLGRTRIVAHSGDGEREIILNPNTGEILRDLWEPKDGGTTGSGTIVDNRTDGSRSGTGSGNGNSGSGNGSDGGNSGEGGNSGSGEGGNSGSGGSSGSGGGDSGGDGDDGGSSGDRGGDGGKDGH